MFAGRKNGLPRWVTALAAALPAAIGMALCMLVAGAARLIG